MKTKLILSAMALLFACTTALAGYEGQGAIAPATTAAAASAAKDDTPVVLEGVLARQLQADTYEFKDDTGTINVEIDEEGFPAGKRITATTRLRLIGEVDRDWGQVEVDVKRLEMLD